MVLYGLNQWVCMDTMGFLWIKSMETILGFCMDTINGSYTVVCNETINVLLNTPVILRQSMGIFVSIETPI